MGREKLTPQELETKSLLEELAKDWTTSLGQPWETSPAKSTLATLLSKVTITDNYREVLMRRAFNFFDVKLGSDFALGNMDVYLGRNELGMFKNGLAPKIEREDLQAAIRDFIQMTMSAAEKDRLTCAEAIKEIRERLEKSRRANPNSGLPLIAWIEAYGKLHPDAILDIGEKTNKKSRRP